MLLRSSLALLCVHISTEEPSLSQQCVEKRDPHGTWSGSIEIGGTYGLTCNDGYHTQVLRGTDTDYTQSVSISCPRTGNWDRDPQCFNIDNCKGLKHGCGNGICLDLSSGYKCDCADGADLVRTSDGEWYCELGRNSPCKRQSCGSHGVCMTLAEQDATFGTMETGGYRCSCEEGYRDNGTVCVPYDCGVLVDVLGTWVGDTQFGGAYTLSCSRGSLVRGTWLEELTISCSGQTWPPSVPGCENLWQEAQDARMRTARWWLAAGGAVLCVLGAAFAAGLTMGFTSLDEFEMRLLEKTQDRDCETEEQKEELASTKRSAAKIRPMLKHRHQLMVTLLLLNSLANEALPIFLDQIVPSVVAVLLSVTCVLFFGEILPTAVFTGPHRMRIVACFAPMVSCLVCVTCLLNKPVSWMLECLVGHGGGGAKYHRAQLQAMLDLHKPQPDGEGELSSEEGAPLLPVGGWCGGAEGGRDLESHGEEIEPAIGESEGSLARQLLTLGKLSVKDLRIRSTVRPTSAPSVSVSAELPVADALQKLLSSRPGSQVVIVPGGLVASFEDFMRAAFEGQTE